jgi:hypothetical protein
MLRQLDSDELGRALLVATGGSVGRWQLTALAPSASISKIRVCVGQEAGAEVFAWSEF